MKRILVGLLLIGGLTFNGNAQVAKTTEGTAVKTSNETQASRQAAKMGKDLNLTSEQRTKVYEFALARLNSVKPLKEKQKAATSKEDKQKIQAEIKTHNVTFDNNVKSVLTPEQNSTYEAQKKAHVEKRKAKVESK